MKYSKNILQKEINKVLEMFTCITRTGNPPALSDILLCSLNFWVESLSTLFSQY